MNLRVDSDLSNCVHFHKYNKGFTNLKLLFKDFIFIYIFFIGA